MRKFGLRTDGTENELEAIIKIGISELNPYTFVEIGTAGGDTLKGVYNILLEQKEKDSNFKFYLLSNDLPNGWSLVVDYLLKNFNYNIRLHTGDGPVPLEEGIPMVALKKPREALKTWTKNNPRISCCFVDGCHGRQCVIDDFNVVKDLISPGGFVLFHDAGIEEQETDLQLHCNENIKVRQAVIDLGLMDGKCEGWTLYKEIIGSRHFGGDGHGCIVVRKDK
jgi:hypothetical protein